ncbi:MAG TPA: tetratricopeptide repeat protein, partial [Candidatus Obscuribacter sp.]|nr:tetratricopeptide repeat protein [Candidatus Obscuribacter sp.]
LTGKLSKAKELYQKALELREKSLSPDNPAIADSLLILGTLEFKSRNLDKAESLFNRAMDINTRNGSAGKDGLSDAQFCLAMVCDAKKDKARALSLAKSSYELRQQSFGEEDQRTVEAKSLMQRLSK